MLAHPCWWPRAVLPIPSRTAVSPGPVTISAAFDGITGSTGLDDAEWGVTLFAKDPLDFKKLVTDMRFDEVSAKYAEFGNFYVGRIING